MRPMIPSGANELGTVALINSKVMLGNISQGNALTVDANGVATSYAQDNTDGQLIRVGSVANPNALPNSWNASNSPVVIQHTLGRIPIGYYVARKSKSCDVYDGTTTAWSTTEISLCITDDTADTTLYIF